jgi:hypothetical protein
MSDIYDGHWFWLEHVRLRQSLGRDARIATAGLVICISDLRCAIKTHHPAEGIGLQGTPESATDQRIHLVKPSKCWECGTICGSLLARGTLAALDRGEFDSVRAGGLDGFCRAEESVERFGTYWKRAGCPD